MLGDAAFLKSFFEIISNWIWNLKIGGMQYASLRMMLNRRPLNQEDELPTLHMV